MRSRIILPDVGGRAPDTTPPASAYDLGQKVRAALACGFFAWLLVFVAVSVATLPGGFWRKWLWGAAASVVVGLLVTGGLGLWWAFLAAFRPWGVDARERNRRWELEDKARKAEEEAAVKAREQVTHGDDRDGNPFSLTDEQRLDLVAIAMLERAYSGRGSPTREAMCQEGVCSQPEWNLVTKAVKRLYLKKDHSWQAATFGEAFALWKESFKVERDEDGAVYAWIQKRNGEWLAIERLA